MGVLSGRHGKESTFQFRRHRRHGFNPWVEKVPWRRRWQPTPVFLLEKSHGQRSLVGYSPKGCKELEETGQLTLSWRVGTWINYSYAAEDKTEA